MKTDNNFIPLSTINPFKKIYAYVDTRDYKADNIFYNKKSNKKRKYISRNRTQNKKPRYGKK